MDSGTEANWVALSKDPWNEIIPGLWQGGMYYGIHMTPCSPGPEDFDVCVAMAGKGGDQTRVRTPERHFFFIEDDHLGPGEMALVMEAVDIVLDGLSSKKKVLVRCQMGWNRSGLVVGLALRSLGWRADEAIDLIRLKRDPSALCNEWFVKYIHAHPGR